MQDISINMDSLLEETVAQGRQPVRFTVLEEDWAALVRRDRTFGGRVQVNPNRYRGVPIEISDLPFPRILEYEDTHGVVTIDDH